jgi:hypothetical protein
MQQLQNESEQLLRIEQQHWQIEDEQRKIVHEQRVKRLENEIAQPVELNSKMNALLIHPQHQLGPRQSTSDNSED